MNLDKFLKILWLINGIGLLVLLLVIAGIAIREVDLLSGNWSHDSYPSSTPDKEAPFRLEYGQPEPIYATENYLLTVGVEQRYVDEGEYGGRVYYGDPSYQSSVNVIFLDKNLIPTKTLLPKKAYINQFRYPSANFTYESDTTARNIIYLIAMHDTNEDGTFDYSDHSDLYISDLSGNNFKQITHDWTISDFVFVQNGQKIRIDYLEKDDVEGIRHFALYDIAEDKLDKLSALDASLNSIKTTYTP